jgi:hypothetical protein
MDRRAWLVVALGLAACGEPGDEVRARWSYIAPAIVQPSCATASCHSRHTAAAGLQLEGVDESHIVLVGTGAGNYVVPGQPGRSQLMFLLRGEETWRMPPDQPLPRSDIELIERWILAGAEND